MSLTRKESNWAVIEYQLAALLAIIIIPLVMFVNTMSETKEERLLESFYNAEKNECTDLINKSEVKADFDNLGFRERTLEVREIQPNRFAIGGEFLLRKWHEDKTRSWFFICDIKFDEDVTRDHIGEWSLVYGAIYGPRRINPVSEYARSPYSIK
ncbi:MULTISPECIES: hypothetical protein [Idiomarina]|jgi:hypothetical protein|uniref:hypothetical protein n=1 Tax=Idiomarina TaxID=135575 RepID=UPI00129B7AC6|nr:MULTISPECIES: hypothetical protein [Idiomarina]MRJ41175.1 hypothetical protein [Idiomarina sp. FeN1]NCU56340.1 hypothetical protein [Idiomarina sp. FenA--70]NCU59359.1 hypothetical protein [Idiomarina sp. FenBw--71]UUN12534.1 hypothetical protein KGF88_07650 [Idiomarina loihiensis]